MIQPTLGLYALAKGLEPHAIPAVTYKYMENNVRASKDKSVNTLFSMDKSSILKVNENNT